MDGLPSALRPGHGRRDAVQVLSSFRARLMRKTGATFSQHALEIAEDLKGHARRLRPTRFQMGSIDTGESRFFGNVEGNKDYQ